MIWIFCIKTLITSSWCTQRLMTSQGLHRRSRISMTVCCTRTLMTSLGVRRHWWCLKGFAVEHGYRWRILAYTDSVKIRYCARIYYHRICFTRAGACQPRCAWIWKAGFHVHGYRWETVIYLDIDHILWLHRNIDDIVCCARIFVTYFATQEHCNVKEMVLCKDTRR